MKFDIQNLTHAYFRNKTVLIKIKKKKTAVLASGLSILNVQGMSEMVVQNHIHE